MRAMSASRFNLPLLLALLSSSAGALAAEPTPPATTPAPVEGGPGEPILDDLDRARTLAPAPGLFAEGAAPKPTVELVSRSVVIAHARWITIPGAIFGAFFDHHESLSNASAGIAVELGPVEKEVWAVEFDWSAFAPTAGNWLAVTKAPAEATYADGGLHMISLDVNYRRQIQFGDRFRIFFGAGLGLGVLLGDIHLAEVLPTCEEPVEKCPHWPNATHREADLPTRVVPIVHLTTGAEVDIGAGLTLRVQGGFRDALYLGLSVGAAL
ncbi:MAG: hypothetical protein U1F43_27575 [Myxococcota bacterium]